MFLKDKRGGYIRACARDNGRKKSEKINPQGTTYPAVSIKAVILSAAIKPLEGCGMVVANIQVSYQNDDMHEKVFVKFIGRL